MGPTLSSTNQIADNLTYITGKHTIRTGVDVRWVRFAVSEIETPSDDYGLFTFNQSKFTGTAFGDLLLGLPNTSYFAVTGPRDNAGGPEAGVYAQDEWQINSRLIVNAGLRWEWLPPFVDKHGIQANFDPNNNTVIVNNVLYLTPTISPNLDQTNTDPVAAGSIVRPDLVGNPIPANRTPNNYFNLNAFAPTPVGAARVGNAGVGILEGPGTIAANAGLSRTITLREGLRLRFEATFTNVLNHTNFAPPATNVSNPSTFGVLQSAQTAENGGNRTGQVALRLDF